MKKLAGLLVFVVALVAAIAVTKYYSTPTQPKQPQPPAPAATPAAPTASNNVSVNVPVTFKTQLVTLDFANRKAHVSLSLERNPARAAPEKIWVWAYFFTPDAPGRYCAGEPVEVRQPFAPYNHASATVDFDVADCPAPRTP